MSFYYLIHTYNLLHVCLVQRRDPSAAARPEASSFFLHEAYVYVELIRIWIEGQWIENVTCCEDYKALSAKCVIGKVDFSSEAHVWYSCRWLLNTKHYHVVLYVHRSGQHPEDCCPGPLRAQDWYEGRTRVSLRQLWQILHWRCKKSLQAPDRRVQWHRRYVHHIQVNVLHAVHVAWLRGWYPCYKHSYNIENGQQRRQHLKLFAISYFIFCEILQKIRPFMI